MAWTAEDLERIDRAIAQGTLSIRSSDGESITYRSIDDLMKARQLIQGLVAAAAGSATMRTAVRYRSGLASQPGSTAQEAVEWRWNVWR